MYITEYVAEIYTARVRKKILQKNSIFFDFFKIIGFKSRISWWQNNEIKCFFYQRVAYGLLYK